MWKKKSQKRSEPEVNLPAPSTLPVNIFIETEDGYFYIENNKLHGILRRTVTARVLNSWAPQSVPKLSEQDKCVKDIKVSGKLKFRNGSLIFSQSDAKMYLVSEFKLRHIRNPDWVHWLGFNPLLAIKASYDEIKLHQIGEPLD